MILGSGEHRYEVVENWAQLPEGWEFKDVAAVACDSQDRVYVFNRGEHPMMVFDRDGRFLRSWGEGQYPRAHGLHIDANDLLYLTDDAGHMVRKCTTDGKVLLELGVPGKPAPYMRCEPFHRCTHTALSPKGEIYVADGYGNARVHRFAADGRHLTSFGRPGSGPGELTTPHAVWVDRRDRVLVADRENDRVQLFDRAGRFLEQWRGFYHPMDIYEDAAGLIYVTDQIPRLSVLSPDGRLLGRCRPCRNTPHGVSGAPDGSIFIAEMNPSEVVRLIPEA
jgi:hypothetical protein